MGNSKYTTRKQIDAHNKKVRTSYKIVNLIKTIRETYFKSTNTNHDYFFFFKLSKPHNAVQKSHLKFFLLTLGILLFNVSKNECIIFD